MKPFLSKGFPDWDPPDFVLDSLMSTKEINCHQYTRPAGYPPLVELLAKRYGIHLNRNIDAYNEIAITSGATQALYFSFMTLLKPSDEIILMEPFFELYVKQIKLTGATIKFVSLGGNAATETDPWALDIELLQRYIKFYLNI
jgi:aspartate/methionine/tyrosine aminotransferase